MVHTVEHVDDRLLDGLLEAMLPSIDWDEDGRASSWLFQSPSQGGGAWEDFPPRLKRWAPTLLTLAGGGWEIIVYQAYRTGTAVVDWHSDESLCREQAMLTLGATRTFGLRNKITGDVVPFPVGHGDLVIMPAGFDLEWEHAVLVDRAVIDPRITLVLRKRL